LISKRTATLPAKEAVKEVLKRIAVLTFAWRHSPATSSRSGGSGLGRRFGIDVHDARLDLLGHLAESIRELLWGRNLELRRIRAIYGFGRTLYTFLNDSTDKNSNK
jgi:hypothetical protein